MKSRFSIDNHIQLTRSIASQRGYASVLFLAIFCRHWFGGEQAEKISYF